MKKLKIVSILLLTLIVFSCKKDNNSNQEIDMLDPVDDELNDILMSIPSDTSIHFTDLKFEDGSNVYDFLQEFDPTFLTEHNVNGRIQAMTPEQQKNLLISRMWGMAHSLVILNNWKNYNGSTQPNGLAYNWGSKNHKKQQIPVIYNDAANKCQEKLYGLDCSGMIYQMALDAGLDFYPGRDPAEYANATFERDTANWNKVFRKSTDYKDLKAVLLRHDVSTAAENYIDVKDLRVGDLIFKTGSKGAIHVGMVLKRKLPLSDSLFFYQSNGKPDLGCDSNKTTRSGPRIVSIYSPEAFGSGKKLFGVDWQVVRFTTCNSTVTDIDGNVYNVVKIGTQCWMKENLKTTRYNDGTAIPTGLSDAAWEATNSGAYAIYENIVDNNTILGKLYNWYAVNTGKLAPAGWHVPTDAELTTLINYLGGDNIAGGKMKSTSTLWNSPNTGATNSSGFTGLPGGDRNNFGMFVAAVEGGGFWSSTVNGTNGAWFRWLYYSNSTAQRIFDTKQFGFSVRCIKD